MNKIKNIEEMSLIFIFWIWFGQIYQHNQPEETLVHV